MLNSLLKTASEIAKIADKLQEEDPDLPRVRAVAKAMDIKKKEKQND